MKNTLHPALEVLASAVMSQQEAPRICLTEEETSSAIACLISDPAAPAQLLHRILPNGTPISSGLYERLHRIFCVTAFGDAGAEIVGHVWTAALLSVEEREQQQLLTGIPTGHHFFVLLNALPFMLKRVRVAPSFLVQLLFELKDRIGNGLVQGRYWRGIEAWASSFPNDAVQGLEILLQRDLDDHGIAISAAVLGSLRVAWEHQNAATLTKLTDELSSHRDVTKRLVHHRSWINTGWIRGLSDAEFMDCLVGMTAGIAQERDEAFNFLRCLILDGRMGQDAVDFGVAWLCCEAKSTLSDNAKHWIATIVHRLGTRWVQDDKHLDSLFPALLAVQPIPLDNKATWMEIEYLLVELLHKNQIQFERWLLALLDADPVGIIAQFRKHGRFEYLCSEMATHEAMPGVTSLFFSTVAHRRELAFILYDELPFDSFAEGTLSALSDEEIVLCLFESRHHHLEPQNIVRLLLALQGRAEAGTNQLVTLFRSELLYQAKNLPGGVLGALKGLVDRNALVRGVVEEAEAYFEKLRAAQHSAINSMEIPGWRRALFIRSRRQSRDIEAHTEEYNVFSKLFSKSYLIYGTEGFRYCQNGTVGEPSPMKAMSMSMEMPRLMMIDPEGAAARHLETGRILDRLSESIAKTKTGKQ